MDNSIGRIEAWVTTALRSVSLRNPEHIHIDWMKGQSADELIRESANAYHRTLDLAGAATSQIMVCLLVPLAGARAFAPASLTYSGMLSQLSTEAPSIYLVDRRAYLAWDDTEHYRRPLDLPELCRERSGVYAEFTISRPADLLARNTPEFDRAVYVRHYVDVVPP